MQSSGRILKSSRGAPHFRPNRPHRACGGSHRVLPGSPQLDLRAPLQHGPLHDPREVDEEEEEEEEESE